MARPRPRAGRTGTVVLCFALVLVLLTTALVVGGAASPARAGRAATGPRFSGVGLGGRAESALRSASASLGQGAGPAQGVAWTCSAPAGLGINCRPRPAGTPGALVSTPDVSVGFPLWHDQSAHLDAGSAGAPEYYYAAAAYDPLLSEVVLYGGCYWWQVYYQPCQTDQTWLYNGTNWTAPTYGPGATPPGVYGEDLVWDPVYGAVLMIGGAYAVYAVYNNSSGLAGAVGNWTWEYDGASGWVNLTSTVGPVGFGVGYAAAAYDDALHEVVLVGGCSAGNCTPGWNDYWVLQNRTPWAALGPGPQVGGGGAWLLDPSMAYDRALQEMVLFGGEVGQYISDQTFRLTGSGWENVTATSATNLGIFGVYYPRARADASMTWDGQLGTLALYGGANRTSEMNDTWYLTTNATWIPSLIFLSVPGPAIAGAAMPTNSSDLAPMLIGGFCAWPYACANSTWVLESPPRPVIYAAGQDPLEPARFNFSGGVQVGTGSGPDWTGLWSDNDSHALLASSSGQNFSSNVTFAGTWQYAEGGAFALTLNVTDFFGVQNQTTTLVNVTVPLSASPFATPGPSEPGVPVVFASGATGGEGTYAYRWGFGDGSPTSSASSPSHTYAAAGTYGAWLNLSDAFGGTVNVSFPVVVAPTLGVLAAPNVTATDLGNPITFGVDSSGGSGTLVSYNWTFGDGGSSGLAGPQHLYTATGSFLASVTVVDSLGVRASDTVLVTINSLPSVQAAASSLSTDTATSVSFQATVTGGTGPFTYVWGFGDGATASGASVTHTFANAGSFTVTVTLTDADGQHSMASVSVAVSHASSAGGLAPGANFYYYVGLGAAGAAIAAGVALGLRRRKPPPVVPTTVVDTSAPSSADGASAGPTGPVPGSP